MSSTFTTTTTFTATHAKHIAAKVATDLKRMQTFYGQPSDSDINDYETEIVALLKSGYLDTVSYGFRKDGNFIEPTLNYTAKELAEGASANDDDPGRIKPGANITGASFYSFLTYTNAWNKLSDSERETYKKGLPHQRTNAPTPGMNGFLDNDKSYSSGGKVLNRSVLRSQK